MHVPDGLMAPQILILGWVIAIVFIIVATKILNKRIEEKKIPLMAMLAAGIFVAQMLNFPIGGGTTGHLVGCALATILLGPYAGIMIITTILIIQCFLFGDGGVTALGLNILNMAIIGSFTFWYVYKLFPERYRNIGIGVASWFAVFFSAGACAIELAMSHSLTNGIYGIPAYISIPAMLGYHTIIGIGEGIITTGIIVYLAHSAPEILKMEKITKAGVSE
ncbi:MAG: energy-coupling factor ABC transporter permease [Candidatus Thermoplasmatota archaeon]